jgi:CBS domain-containing protein
MLMVKHMMIEDVVTAMPSITLKDGIRILQEKKVGSIVITDNNGKCVGLFTERDAIRLIANDVSQGTQMDQVMTRNVHTIGEEASFEEARLFIISHGGFRHVPVVNSKGELVGLFSVRKLLDEFFGL